MGIAVGTVPKAVSVEREREWGVRECLPFRNYRTADTIAGAVLGLIRGHQHLCDSAYVWVIDEHALE